MTNSFKMVKLDFFTMKSQLASYAIVILFVLLFGFMGSSITWICINCAWFVALMSTMIFATQEKNNLNRLYGSLSIRQKDIVLGRYIFSLMSFVVSFIVVIAIFTGFMLLQGKMFAIQEIFRSFGVSYLIFSAIVGLQTPIFFKIGYIKARIWAFVPLAIVIGLAVLLMRLESLSGIIAFCMSYENILIICCIAASCIIQYLSYRVAIVTYRKGKRV